MKNIFLIFACLFILSCSSSHQILFSVPPQPANSARQHFTVGIYAPDSLRNFLYSATLSGGLCAGHEFDLHIGNGIIETLRNSLASVYDSVIMLDVPQPDLQRVFYPEIKTPSANADFSPTTFGVKITGTIYFKLHIKETVPSITDDIAWKEFFKNDIIISAESSGKAQDCHDAVPYLKKAGEAAMVQLRDSIINRFSNFIK